ncbi:MAG: UDP-2,3-diacylglucosamine diphosphatase [Planctomycetes bacterium]|nr:UDP-2,3-diacylglucosamine diphosphatase [Planctomycetota bacterium]
MSTTTDPQDDRGRAKRRVDLAIISDVHLGAKSCRADELRRYLKSIEPRELILNGDIIDMWEFKKGYWPDAHVKVVRRILKLAASGVPVHFVTGNHDEALRAYSGMHFGNLHLVDQLERVIDGQRAWIIHGDALEAAMAVPRWLSALGTWSYDAAVVVDTWLNRARSAFGWNRVSFAQQLKHRLKGAREHIVRYEDSLASGSPAMRRGRPGHAGDRHATAWSADQATFSCGRALRAILGCFARAVLVRWWISAREAIAKSAARASSAPARLADERPDAVTAP